MKKEFDLTSVRGRLKAFVNYLGISEGDFEIGLGISKGYVSSIKDSIGKKNLPIILEKYPNLQRNWLLYGEGVMLKEGVSSETAKDRMQRHMNEIKNRDHTKVVPVLGDGGAKASPQLQMTDTDWSVTEYREVSGLFDDSEAILPVYDKSMMPTYNPGCELALVRDLSNGYIPGEAYVLQIKGSTIPLLKRVFDGKKKGTILLYSDNTSRYENGSLQGEYHYPPFEIRAIDVVAKYTIVGEQHRRANRPLLHKIEK